MGVIKNKMKGIMHKMMFTCEEASFTFSKSFHNKLTFAEKQRLRMHYAMCKPCRNFKATSTILNHGIRKISDQEENISVFKLSDQKKAEIIKALKNKK